MEPKVHIEKCLMSFVFKVQYPLFEEELRPILVKKKYKIEQSMTYEDGHVSIKNLKIAERNNCDIVFNPDVSVLFIVGKNWNNTFKEFIEIEKILIDDLDFDFSEMIRSFEVVSENRIRTGNKPRKMIDKFYENCEKNSISDLFEEEGSLVSIRFAPNNKEPSSDNWYDLLIEPATPLHYFLRIIYRNEDIEKFKNIASNIDEKILASINMVEEK